MRFDRDVWFVLMLMACIVIAMCGINLVQAYDDIGYARTGNPYTIYLGCSYNNSYCANTFTCNLTVYSPSFVIVNNQQMGNTSYPQYNYTILGSNISQNGLYYGREVCCDATVGCSNDYSFQFHVNPQGKDNSNDGTVYAIMFSLLIILFGLSIYYSIKIPFKNQKNGDGYVVMVDWKKYLKIGAFFTAYLSWIGITYFAWNLSYGILQFDEMANFFQLIFRVSFIGMFLVFPITFIFFLVRVVRDKEIYNKLVRGLTVK